MTEVRTKKIVFYKLYFKGPLHIGSKPTGQLTGVENFIHSDTLASAMASVLVLAGILTNSNEVENFLKALALSSAFPFVEKEKETYYFFPAPKGFVLSKDPSQRKLVKKVQWYELEAWKKLLANKFTIPGNIRENIVGAYFVETENAKEIVGGIMKKEERMRVQIPRTPGDAEPFSSEELHFRNEETKKAGLFFIVPEETELTDLLEFALDTLADLGIGADRTIGYGHFEWKKESKEINFPKSNVYMTLGVYSPSCKELGIENEENQGNIVVLDPYKYDLILRSGWITRDGDLNVRRNSVYMFGEGSVFKRKKKEYKKDKKMLKQGIVRDVSPQILLKKNKPPVFRSGRTLLVPIILQEKGQK